MKFSEDNTHVRKKYIWYPREGQPRNIIATTYSLRVPGDLNEPSEETSSYPA